MSKRRTYTGEISKPQEPFTCTPPSSFDPSTATPLTYHRAYHSSSGVLEDHRRARPATAMHARTPPVFDLRSQGELPMELEQGSPSQYMDLQDNLQHVGGPMHIGLQVEQPQAPVIVSVNIRQAKILYRLCQVRPNYFTCQHLLGSCCLVPWLAVGRLPRDILSIALNGWLF